jgi:hypothetical protein
MESLKMNTNIQKAPKRNQERERDHSLDLLKGVACILMLFAHTQLQIDLPSKALTFLGGFTPVLFFAVSGITANFQAHKYPVAGIVLTYTMIFLLGLSFAAMIAGNFWLAFNMDILQIIAVGVLMLYLVQRYLNPGEWFHLGAAVAIFALKLATDLIPRDSWWMMHAQNILLEPGNFVVIPWVFPFFLGMFCHLTTNHRNLWLAGVALLASIVAWAAGVPLGIDNRWDMSIGFFLFSLILTSVAFYVARCLPPQLALRSFPWLIWLGKNSLFFLYVHIGVIWMIRTYTQGIWGSYWIWPVVAMMSLGLMWALPPLLVALRVPSIMSGFKAWIGLLLMILVAPLVVPLGAPLVVTEFALGLVFALYYTSLTQALKGLAWPSGHSRLRRPWKQWSL